MGSWELEKCADAHSSQEEIKLGVNYTGLKPSQFLHHYFFFFLVSLGLRCCTWALLSLVVASRGYSSLRWLLVKGFSLRGLLLLPSMGSRLQT